MSNTWEADRKASTQQAAEALKERIQRYFTEQAQREQAINLEVNVAGEQQESDGLEVRRVLHFTLPDGTLLEGFYRISNVGGNMYEVHAGIGDRSAAFTISLPDASAAAEDTYSRPVCDFLLEEIERAAGEIHLREESGPT